GTRVGARRGGVAAGAAQLRQTQEQLGRFLDQRGGFKSGVRQTLDLLEAFAAALPALPEAIDDRLEEQEAALQRLGGSLDRVTGALPEGSRGAVRTGRMARPLLLLAAALVFLHGLYLVYTSTPRFGPAGGDKAAA